MIMSLSFYYYLFYVLYAAPPLAPALVISESQVVSSYRHPLYIYRVTLEQIGNAVYSHCFEECQEWCSFSFNRDTSNFYLCRSKQPLILAVPGQAFPQWGLNQTPSGENPHLVKKHPVPRSKFQWFPERVWGPVARRPWRRGYGYRVPSWSLTSRHELDVAWKSPLKPCKFKGGIAQQIIRGWPEKDVIPGGKTRDSCRWSPSNDKSWWEG